MADKEKELNELKKKHSHLQDIYTISRNLTSELQKKNEFLEIQNRTLEEELSTNKENYENLKKRYELLQIQFVEAKNKYSSKSGMFDWILNSNAKEENQKLKEKFEAIQAELDLKIHENGKI